MAWYSDYDVRRSRLEREGLLVLVRGARVDAASGFLAVYLEANQGDLLRSDADREFALHQSLGFASDYGLGVAASPRSASRSSTSTWPAALSA
jgi:hypothetical protein